MLGTQQDVTAGKTSFDNNGLPVPVYNRTKTKSKDQVSKETLWAQHLCGPGRKSRVKDVKVSPITGGEWTLKNEARPQMVMHQPYTCVCVCAHFYMCMYIYIVV